MPRLGNITDIDPESDYRNRCKDGKCSQCGECCSDLLPLSTDEIKRIKAYMKAHTVKMHHRNFPIMQNQFVDLTCPFRNDAEKKCEIYEVRPMICRCFICSKPLQNAHYDRDLVAKDRVTRSMRDVFFEDHSGIDLIEKVNALALFKMFGNGDFPNE